MPPAPRGCTRRQWLPLRLPRLGASPRRARCASSAWRESSGRGLSTRACSARQQRLAPRGRTPSQPRSRAARPSPRKLAAAVRRPPLQGPLQRRWRLPTLPPALRLPPSAPSPLHCSRLRAGRGRSEHLRPQRRRLAPPLMPWRSPLLRRLLRQRWWPQVGGATKGSSTGSRTFPLSPLPPAPSTSCRSGPGSLLPVHLPQLYEASVSLGNRIRSTRRTTEYTCKFVSMTNTAPVLCGATSTHPE